MAEDWQSQKFRQNVISKINELLQSTGQDPSKNPTVMESHIFKKSRTKDEYLGLVAKLLLHFKDLPQRKPQPPPPNAEINQQNMMQDPLNALQNLASQGNRNPQMMSMPSGSNPNQMVPNQMSGGPVAASNLLQTLNQQRPGQQMQQMQGIRNQMPINSGMQMNVMGGNAQQAQMVGSGPQVVGMGGQMNQLGGGNAPTSGSSGPSGPTGGPNQMQMNVNAMNIQQMQQLNQNQMAIGMNHPQLNQMINARMAQNNAMNVGPNASGQGIQGMPANIQQGQPGQMHGTNVGGPQQVTGPPNSGQPGNLNQMLNIPANIQQKPNMVMGQGGQMYPVNRAGQQQFLRQSPSPSTVPSPAGINTQQQQQQLQQQQQQQQQGAPNTQVPTPQLSNPQMISSPAVVPTSSPQMSNLMQNNQRNMRQSPSTAISTTGQVNTNSPFNPQEDQLYREKYKQLTKYIDPLKRMVAKIGNDGANTEKITKMSKLLEILCNPTQRVPLETLLKCEKALEKMDIGSYSGQQFGKSSNPLMEVLGTTLQSPIANHTLYRTFRPSLELLFGTDISGPLAPKRARTEKKRLQYELEIPHILQGEIARLDEKFKVTLDPTWYHNSKLIKLTCCLDDRRLPSVPAIYIDITEDYPLVPPRCNINEQEFTIPFLANVLKAFTSRIDKLPKCYSLTLVLEVWEMAVRQACSPTATSNCPSFCLPPAFD